MASVLLDCGLHLILMMGSVATNDKDAAALCTDSASYRNPFNGYSCSEHNGTICTDWIDVLDGEQLDDLLVSCPESCDVVSECLL